MEVSILIKTWETAGGAQNSGIRKTRWAAKKPKRCILCFPRLSETARDNDEKAKPAALFSINRNGRERSSGRA